MVSGKEDQEAKRAQNRAAHADLAKWRSAADFIARVDQIASGVPSNELFGSRKFNFLTEALAIAEFVTLHPVDEVRLNDPDAQHPDAYVRTGGEVVEVEATEALNSGRRRGDEYQRPLIVRHSTPEEREARRAELEPAIRRAIEKKVDRGNHNGLLLVYVELQIHFELTPDEEALVAAIKQRYRPKFRDIYVVCKGRVY